MLKYKPTEITCSTFNVKKVKMFGHARAWNSGGMPAGPVCKTEASGSPKATLQPVLILLPAMQCILTVPEVSRNLNNEA